MIAKVPPKFLCNDCGVDVLAIGDWYMARPETWADLGLGWDDNLCLACLEQRMGRPLRPGMADIGPASTFFPSQPPLSQRLRDLWKEPSARTKARKRK
ncbi:hypothetical protein KIP88_14820 [Bradyrhizobium sp. SRL28]|uniref:hypothetical protein n=1 Tax=Bradyrhizobium sp. SRL28 TaxID=2836178 RepID=UPI001BDF2C1D|nr:hypothetical protein [Bradyrhizobium sp. SRL28]MBT1511782.1 hypothetical protein [Bradyrhizobium sp. SRL28]